MPEIRFNIKGDGVARTERRGIGRRAEEREEYKKRQERNKESRTRYWRRGEDIKEQKKINKKVGR